MIGPRASFAVTLACASLCGCSGNGWDWEPMPPLGPTLLIVNESSLVYRVSVSPGLAVYLYPNEQKCVQVGKASRARRIEFAAPARSRRYYTPRENLMTASGWIVEMGQRPKYDVLSLRPWKVCAA